MCNGRNIEILFKRLIRYQPYPYAKFVHLNYYYVVGMVKTEVFIVSLFGVGTIIILCFSIGCFCEYKKYHKANVNPNSDTDQNIGVNNRIYEVAF